MAFYTYRAVTKKGKDVVDVIEASSNIDALNKVRDLGLYPVKVVETGHADIKKKKEGISLNIELEIFREKRVKPRNMVIFIRQFATLINAGLPLLKSIKILSEQQRAGALKTTLQDLANSIESGNTFSESLLKHPDVFSKLFVNMVKAGEAAGVMEIVLLRLADFYESSHKIKAKVRSALIYPALVVSAAICVMLFLVVFIIPKFAQMFQDMDLKLPLPTRILIGIANGMLQWYTWVIIVALIAGIIFAYRAISKTPKGKLEIDRFKINCPLFGILVQKVAIARFARTLGTLVSSGVPLLKALTIVKDVIGNEVVSSAIAGVSESIREGESIAGPLKQHKIFSAMVINMIDVGEETGRLDEMLIKIADTYDDDVDVAVSSLTSVLEPILIITLAFIVGSIVISLFLPLISLISSLSAST